MITSFLIVALSAPVLPSLTFCEIRDNYVDSVVNEIKAGRTLMHASMLEMSKTGETGIANKIYSGLDNIGYSEVPKYNKKVEAIANKIKSECR